MRGDESQHRANWCPRRSARARVLSSTGSVTGAGAGPGGRVVSAGHGRTSGAPRQRPWARVREEGQAGAATLSGPSMPAAAAPSTRRQDPSPSPCRTASKTHASRPARPRRPGTRPNNGAVMTPVYLTSTYAQEAPAVPRQATSTRGRRTRRGRRSRRTSPPRGRRGLCRIGLASTNAPWIASFPATTYLRQRSLRRHVPHLHEGLRALRHWLQLRGHDPAKAIAAAMTPATKYVYIETPSNPLLSLTDTPRKPRTRAARPRRTTPS